ncbi:hypothetical protein [Mesorhizobium sp. 10J20-29]
MKPDRTKREGKEIDIDREFRLMWLREQGELIGLSQASHAFALIASSAQHERRRPVFWFPDYFCNDALQSLRDTGAELVFYPITQQFNPDWASCESLSRRMPPDFFVIVHFFGQYGEVEAAKHFCERFRARLVEDATHVFFPAHEVGLRSDFVLYSPRKFFDVQRAGILICRNGQEGTRIAKEFASKGSPENDLLRNQLKTMERLFKRHILRRRPKAQAVTPRRIRTVLPSTPLDPGFHMSRYARQRIAYAVRSGISNLIAEELRNFEMLVRGYLELGTAAIPTTDGLVSCWVGLSCDNEIVAQSAMDRLRSINIHTAPWPNELPPEVISQPAHEVALRLRNRTLVANRRRSCLGAELTS